MMKKYPLLDEHQNRELQSSWSLHELDLTDIKELHARLGFPCHNFPVIHIAGTKGKGSTAEMFSSVLQEAGMRVGVYSSPHIISLEERIRINGEFIPENRLSEILEQKMRSVVQELESEGRQFSFFELLTIAAFEYFSEEKIDAAVLETGIGGAHDATNICRPILTVITNIALDHTEQLGETLEEIAFEKAGIIKDGVRVIVGEMPPEVHERVFPVISKIAKEHLAPTAWAGIDFPSRTFPGVALGMAGSHQQANAAVVCQAARLFSDTISLQMLWDGLKKAVLPGRLETVSENPLTLLDAAHNPEAIAKISEWVRERYSENSKVFVFAAAKDKDWKKMLQELLLLKPKILILTRFPQERAASPSEMETWLLEKNNSEHSGISVCRIDDPREAVLYAGKRFLGKTFSEEKNAMILVTGSFFLIREVYPLFQGTFQKLHFQENG
ncbi:MAG: bifunctional folylpolyglutamate synthase/dihydrofolate synthase [Thermoguttaceae bacterium]|nr:bifunctional folylpolyglutamate synthase/dihydrofolate synthase [Thermoguttaceae bacterium]